MALADQLAGLTIRDARELLDSREVSSVELAEAHLERIGGVDERVKAFVTVTADLALAQAARADERIAAGQAGPLTGIPMQLKDNMSTRGVATTCSSRMLEGFVPPFDATVTQRLYETGAVLLGKGNLDEFAMGSSTENSALFTTRNPWDTERVPGGSSGGPSAAVAAAECVFSLGSDTGGSIRQPAALCGVTGMKPTYGVVSRYGLIAFASSLDQIGPITKDVADCAIVLNAIAGHDPRDSTSHRLPSRPTTRARSGMGWTECGWACPGSTLRPESSRAWMTPCARPSAYWRAWARPSRRLPCPTPATRWPSITSSLHPRRRRIWRGTTA